VVPKELEREAVTQPTSPQANSTLSTPSPPAATAPPRELAEEIALCLSGGGYRAMLFHVGALLRLNEDGLLPKLGRVSSVSGGSITAGVLALRWKDLDFDAAGKARRLNLVVDAIREFAHVTVDAEAILKGILLPGTISDRVVGAYDKHLFSGKTLQDLPAAGPGSPCFVFNATNVQTGSLWRFQRDYMGAYQVGLADNPTTPVAVAVAASSAFPPVLSPATLKPTQPVQPVKGAALNRPPFTTEVVLSDGGVYDNLGLEVPWKRSRTILVSDGGQKMGPEEKPAHNWASHAVRIMEIIDNQVRSLRKRWLIDAYDRGDRTGTYWGVRSDYTRYPVASAASADPLGRAGRNPGPLAEIHTRLEALDDATQQKLINWGFAICDAALLSHWGAAQAARYGDVRPAQRFPFEIGY
jgi:NTE family protein